MQCLKVSGTDTICSLIQPLCNTVYTSNKGLDEPTSHGIWAIKLSVSRNMLLVACSDDVVWDAVEPVNAGESL